MRNDELKKGNWVKIYGRVLTGNGLLKLDEGRHPYIVVLDSNNKYIGKSFLLVQGTTYNESLLWQKELLENNEGCIVHLNHQSFIFTNNYHLIAPSKIDNVIGEIEIGDLHTIGTQLVSNFNKNGMNENLLKTLMSRINFTSLEEFEDVLEEFLPAIDMNLQEFLELKYDEFLCLKDFDLGTFIKQYKNDPVQILTSLIFWNKDNIKLNTLFEKWDKQDYIFSKYDNDADYAEDTTEEQSMKI